MASKSFGDEFSYFCLNFEPDHQLSVSVGVVLCCEQLVNNQTFVNIS